MATHEDVKVTFSETFGNVLSWRGIKDISNGALSALPFISDTITVGSLFQDNKHVVICSGAEVFLKSEFPDIEASQTIIDAILNHSFTKKKRLSI
jgi:hypothetical protein